MATIYRFIVEDKTGRRREKTSGRGSKGVPTKGASKKGKHLPTFKNGVEHNRKMRAINPLINKVTYGVNEKAMRLGRATGGLFYRKPNGKLGISGPAFTIIIAYLLMQLWNAIAKFNQNERSSAERVNKQNYKQLENGVGSVHGAYSVSTNWWSGKMTYNENK